MDDPAKVDSKNRLPVSELEIADVATESHPRVVEHEVESPVLVDSLSDQTVHLMSICDVNAHRQSSSSRRLDVLGHALSSCFVDVSDDHGCPTRRESMAQRTADSGCSAGDDCHFPAQLFHSAGVMRLGRLVPDT